MRDQFLLICSTNAGTPANASFPFRHWVRRSDNAHMNPVAQMSAGGAVPQDDCAPADVLSRSRDDGRNPPMRTLERLCGTGGRGTSEQNLRSGLLSLGYQARVSYTSPATIGWLMNPAWGGLISPALNGPYLAAFTGTSVIIDTPGAWETAAPPVPTPGPPHPTTQETEMDTRYIPSWNGQQQLLQVDGAGNLIHRWFTGAKWAGETIATGLRSFGSVDWAITSGQLQVWSQRPNGVEFHAFQVADQGFWHTEEIS